MQRSRLFSRIPVGGIGDRAVWALLATLAGAVVVTARILTPDPIHGSSAQLGIAPCGFYVFTGYRCPGCGLTTAFAYMAHFDLAGAWHANAFGIPLFLSTLLFVPFAIYAITRRWSVSGAMDVLYGERVALVYAFLAFAYWLVRFAIEWQSHVDV